MKSEAPIIVDTLKGHGDSDKSGKVVRMSEPQFLSHS